MGIRNTQSANFQNLTVSLATHTGNNATVASAAFDAQGDIEQGIIIHANAWNGADTVVGGFVEFNVQHSDDTVAANFVDVPNDQLSVNGFSEAINGANTIAGGAATGVVHRIVQGSAATVARATYLGSKRFYLIKTTTQTNVASGFLLAIIRIVKVALAPRT